MCWTAPLDKMSSGTRTKMISRILFVSLSGEGLGLAKQMFATSGSGCFFAVIKYRSTSYNPTLNSYLLKLSPAFKISTQV